MQIGFIGVGLMGGAMVGRLLAHGHAVRVIAHRNRAPVEAAVAAGAVESRDAAELTQGVDAVFLCVSDSKAVAATIDAMMPHLKKGQLVVDATTADPDATRRVAARLEAKGIAFADAPMTGGPEQVRAGEAGVLVGADPATFARVRPLIATYAKSILHFGPVGTGHTAKLISNSLACSMVAAIAETYGMARKAGVDWRMLYEVQLAGSTQSGALRKMVGPALDGDFDGYAFSIANALKDIDYFLKMSDGLGARPALATVVADMLRRAATRGHGTMRVSRMIDPAFEDVA
ncbi:MAG TPA: NAD(P)-dependent oxidoreductase [Aestuariivirgaceae bacterium]|nr:NAD(P)-dependent oxidoreductase [Aestuariivirgaceae bacterium]